PREGGIERVADIDVECRAFTVVRDRDGEANLAPDHDRGLMVGLLGDAKHRAVDDDVGFVAVVPVSAGGLVVRADSDGVVGRSTVGEVRVAANVDDDHIAVGQVAEVAVEYSTGDRIARVGDRTAIEGDEGG